MKTLHVELPAEMKARRYPIYVGANLLGNAALIAPHIAGRQVLVVSNSTVAPLYLSTVLESLADYDVRHIRLPDGEQYKTLEQLQVLFDCLLENHFSRDCTLLALGGGVIGDITGFAAACYQRGVNFVQLPTTLLAQVDSAVGGKTAINHPRGKNMIGAFHQPIAVIADTQTLQSLPDRELRAGLAEVIKYGIIADAEFFAWLENNIEPLLKLEENALSYAIERSCAIKAAIVAADEREAGQRMMLNLGHTFGHAIETAAGYGHVLHGEAVAIGMVMAARLAVLQGKSPTSETDRIIALLHRADLPTQSPDSVTTDQLLANMQNDKKNVSGQLRLVIPCGIGCAEVITGVPESDLRVVIESP
ncbi:MAG TPA: 3-dehydroquinate synthase [Gammaproteobacteria bacterium]|nr:3-dehydroquinate synthase [Gammaproteobacteria bacterium]